MARLLNRLRILLDTKLTASNALDLTFHSHPDSVLFHLEKELPYQLLPGNEIRPRQLLPFVNRLGNLLKKAGMNRYDRVAIFKSNSPDYFFLGLAIIKAGGICVPVNPGMKTDQISYYLNYTGCKILITDQGIFEQQIKDTSQFTMINTWLFPNLPEKFKANGMDINKELEKCSSTLNPVLLHKDSAVFIVHTSGTTGFPKGVLCTSGSIIAGVKGHFVSEPVSKNFLIGIAGFYNHLVYYVGFYTSMLGNFSSKTLDRPDPEKALEMIEKHKIDIFFAFSDVYMKMYCAGLDKYDLRSVKIWVATADASHEVHMEAFCRYGAFFRLFGRRIIGSIFIDVLGTSEVGSGAVRRIYSPFSKPKYNRVIGRPIPGGPSVKVADEYGKKLGAGKPGRLMVKGNTLFKGYWNAHDMLNDVVLDGWWWTGDITYRDRWGRFYHLDRAVDMIPKRNGIAYTLLIEEKLLTYPEIGEAVVIGLPTREKELASVAIIHCKPGKTINKEDFLKWANEKLEPGMGLIETLIVGPDDIPRGLTGKVLKRTLRERYAPMLIPSEVSVSPSNP